MQAGRGTAERIRFTDLGSHALVADYEITSKSVVVPSSGAGAGESKVDADPPGVEGPLPPKRLGGAPDSEAVSVITFSAGNVDQVGEIKVRAGLCCGCADALIASALTPSL